MNEVMHSDKPLIDLKDIDYSNQEQVEEQSAIRRDWRESFIGREGAGSGMAALLESEIEEIARRFVKGISK